MRLMNFDPFQPTRVGTKNKMCNGKAGYMNQRFFVFGFDDNISSGQVNVFFDGEWKMLM